MQYVTSGQMKRIDEITMNDFEISILQMMEKAGSNLAKFVLSFKPRKVVILYGKGNNGGGGLVAARYLSKDINVIIVPASKNVNDNVNYQLSLLKNAKEEKKVPACDIIIDAMLGYNISGNPKGRYAELIRAANKNKAKIVSLDVPSGVNPDTGEAYKPAISADYVLTLALPKNGLKKVNAKIYLANIGIPEEVYKKLGIDIEDYFAEGDIVEVE